MTTPNMGLTLPTDHGSAEVWDTILDTVFNTIDSHDHTPGKGALISASAVKVAADKSWSFGGTSYAITDLKAIDFVPVASTTVTSLAGAFFVSDGTGGLTANELYFRTTSGVNVKFTSGAALNVAAFTGGIGGDYSAVGAAVAYDDSLDRYTFKQQGNVWARMASGEVRILETGSSDSVYVGHAAPAALAASYTVTWPLALPASTVPLNISSAGQVAFGFSHSDKILPVSPLAGTSTGNNTWAVSTTTHSSTASGTLLVGIPLIVGDRIKSVDFTFLGNGTADLVTDVVVLDAAGASTSIGTRTDNNQPASPSTFTLNVTDTTVVVNTDLRITFAANAAGISLLSISVTYDHP